MLKLKDNSVCTEGTTREIWFGLGVAERAFAAYGFDCVVTSLTDGEHKAGSLHAKGMAADLRVKQVSDLGIRQKIYEEIKFALRPHGFDVVPEGGVAATDQDTALTTGAHIHIEFDPKAGQSCLTLQ